MNYEDRGIGEIDRSIINDSKEMGREGIHSSYQASVRSSDLHGGESSGASESRDSERTPYGYIYITENLINGKRYIGQHKSQTFDASYKGSGKTLLRAINKYGKDNFKTEVIEWCYSRDSLNEREIYWIDKLGAVWSRDFYNIAFGGDGGDTINGKSEEDIESFKSKMRDITTSHWKNPEYVDKVMVHRRGENHPMYGKHHTDEAKEKNRLSQIGRKHSEEARKKMSDSRKGEKHWNYGKHHSDETREKIRIANMGHIDSEDTKRKKSDSAKHRKFGSNNHYVRCIETGRVFNRFSDACEFSGVCYHTLRDRIKSGKPINGYHYIDSNREEFIQWQNSQKIIGDTSQFM